MARIRSINVSAEKGVMKKPVPAADLDAAGIIGDAHAGGWHRQVSLLSRECITQFAAQAGTTYNDGDFAENLTTEGLDLATLSLGDRLTSGSVELEVTQIGKSCHGGGCAVYREVGRCVMPKEGIFTRVLRGGPLRAGDPLVHHPRPLRVMVITLSDRASRGEYEDRSGPAIEARIQDFFSGARWHLEITRALIPDDAVQLNDLLSGAIKEEVEVLITTGGTGIGRRDITPEVIAPLLTKKLPGLMEFVRMKHGERLPSALLSRSLAGVANGSLIYALPGSVKAVGEYLEVILPTIEHSLQMLWDMQEH